MKIIVGIALGIGLMATSANAGNSLGGFGGNGMYYDAANYTLYIPGKLAERFAIMREGTGLYSDYDVYPMSADDFARLRNAADSRLTISAKGESGTRSYRVYPGDQYNEVELIDRRAAIRDGQTQY
jgi:hypothetical protein